MVKEVFEHEVEGEDGLGVVVTILVQPIVGSGLNSGKLEAPVSVAP